MFTSIGEQLRASFIKISRKMFTHDFYEMKFFDIDFMPIGIFLYFNCCLKNGN